MSTINQKHPFYTVTVDDDGREQISPFDRRPLDQRDCIEMIVLAIVALAADALLLWMLMQPGGAS